MINKPENRGSYRNGAGRRYKPLPDIVLPNTNDYRNLHYQINVKFGKANKCENLGCENRSKVFDWALKKGLKYSLNRNDYQMLCRACHATQDTAKGENQAYSKLKEHQVIYIKHNPDMLTEKELSVKFSVSQQNINSIRNNNTWKHLSLQK